MTVIRRGMGALSNVLFEVARLLKSSDTPYVDVCHISFCRLQRLSRSAVHLLKTCRPEPQPPSGQQSKSAIPKCHTLTGTPAAAKLGLTRAEIINYCGGWAESAAVDRQVELPSVSSLISACSQVCKTYYFYRYGYCSGVDITVTPAVSCGTVPQKLQ